MATCGGHGNGHDGDDRPGSGNDAGALPPVRVPRQAPVDECHADERGTSVRVPRQTRLGKGNWVSADGENGGVLADEGNREVSAGEEVGGAPAGGECGGVSIAGENGGIPAGGRGIRVPAEDADFSARWAKLRPLLEIVHDVPRSPAEQMALDERWAREVASGDRRPTLRIWEWSGSCVVVGRFQSIPDEVHEDVARAEGIEVVRRCTGGGAMFIEPGNTITYSLYAPLWFVDGIDVAASYRLCDRWLVGALGEMGLDVRFSGLNDIASARGKIGGAAQRRFPASSRAAGGRSDDAASSAFGGAVAGRCVPPQATGHGPGAVLHHVTMAYDIDAAKMGRVLNTSREKMSDKAVRSAVKRVDPLKSQTGLTRGEVVARLLAYLHDHVR
ncbi:lipoate--protein ligase family protein [Bifidobacterium sp. MA2]|uniref:Lipoate--protein ligase family protein n=2 Tax=Bifidobacterium santillanense TaxID=2809028 RepID=A0ABS5UPJ4_9BIFI|nr:lipoate--protein ligase family protein [Bifidobacterium santillanense]